MFNKRQISILFLFLIVMLCAISHASANDLNTTGDEMATCNDETRLEETSSKTFFDLNNTINGNDNTDIHLDCNYTFNSSCDMDYKYGIEIDRGVTVYGNGHTIDASKQARIFLANNKSIVFRDIVFKNGHVTYNDGAINGGAINGNFTCINCTFIGNYAINAGAVNGGTVINCSFLRNCASYWGGAMYYGSVYNCTFIDNSADYGGALWYCFACENSVFIDNFASLTGGAINHAPIVNCTFIGNYAQKGGAVRASTVKNSRFINNTGYWGAAMFSVTGDSAINCTFINNKATREGGALHGVNSINCTFTNNSAPAGGAMYHAYCFDEERYASQDRDINYIYCVNSTFNSNHADGEGGAAYNVVASNSLFENNSAKMGGAMSGIKAMNCTFTNNHATDCGGAVYNVEVIDDSVFNNNTSPLGDDTYNATLLKRLSAFSDLNRTINSNNLTEISLDRDYAFNPSCDLELKEGINIKRAVTVNGNGHTIDGSYSSRSFVVSNNEIVLKNILFTNCVALDYGGAIRGFCTIINCTFINNMAENGGALYQANALNCTFTGNSAIKGGALYNGNAENSNFINNYAEDYGGAIYSYSSYGNVVENCEFISNTASNGGATYEINAANCIFTNNSAEEKGGAMFGGIARNSNFSLNHAGDEGGAIHNADCGDSLFEYNSAPNGGAMSNGIAVKSTFNHNNATGHGGAVLNANVSTDCRFKNNVNDDTYNVTFFEKKYRKTFKDLNGIINGNVDNVIYLNEDYEFDAIEDFEMFEGININRPVTIYGNGHTINGNCSARIFLVNSTNVVFRNLNLINACSKSDGGAIRGNSTCINCTFANNVATSTNDGGAIYYGSAIDCTFINNSAYYGGAIYYGLARDCTFIDNYAKYGGAVYSTPAISCIFINNSAKYCAGAIYGADAYNCIFENNTAVSGNDTYYTNIHYGVLSSSDYISIFNSGNKLPVNLTADEMPIDNVNVTIKVYRDNRLIGTYNCLSGDEWPVNLDCGSYVAVLSVDNPTVKPLNVTLTINGIPTSLTSSDVEFQYNAEGYLIASLNDVDGNALSGKHLSIDLNEVTYSNITDENGQVMVLLSKLVPGTYIASIAFNGDENYAKSSANAKVVIKKATPKLTASKKTFKIKTKTKKYTITLKNNKNKAMKNSKVTLKVKGKTYTARTNSKGKATFKITKLTKKGTFKAVIKYSGNKYYAAKSKTVKITVKK